MAKNTTTTEQGKDGQSTKQVKDRIVIDNPVKTKTGEDLDVKNPPMAAQTREKRDAIIAGIIGSESANKLKTLSGTIKSGIMKLIDLRGDELKHAFNELMDAETHFNLLVTDLVINDIAMSMDLFMYLHEVLSELDEHRNSCRQFLEFNSDFKLITARFGPRYIKHLTVAVGDLKYFFLQGARFHSVGVFQNAPKEGKTWVSPMDQISFSTMLNWWAAYHQTLPIVADSDDPRFSIEEISKKQLSIPIIFANDLDFI